MDQGRAGHRPRPPRAVGWSPTPTGEYLDVGGVKTSAADVADAAGRIAGALAGFGVERGDRVATLIENSNEAMLAWWGIVAGGACRRPDQHRLQGRVPAPPARPTPALGCCSSSPTWPTGPSGSSTRSRRSSTWWCSATPSRTSRRRCTAGRSCSPPSRGPSPTCARATSPPSSTPAAPPARRRAACSATPTTARCPARSGSAGGAPPTTWCGRRCRCSTSTPSSRRCSDRSIYGGRAAIYRRFSVSNFWSEMNRVGATVTSTLGTMAYLLANDIDRPEQPRSGAPEANTSLRLIGAAPLPVEIDQALRQRFGVDTFSGAYGVTEASLVSWQPPGVENRPNAAGVINDEYFDVRIFDDDDGELPRGTDGEIVLRPKRPHTMFEGYWGRPDATVETSRNWWYHTGDIGRIDDDGYLYFVDRKADYLRRRGENISQLRGRAHRGAAPRPGRRGRARGALASSPRTTSRSPRRSARTRRSPRRSSSAGASSELPVLRPAALHRAPRRAPAVTGRPGAQARAPRRGPDRRLVGRRGVRHHLREARATGTARGWALSSSSGRVGHLATPLATAPSAGAGPVLGDSP